MQQTGGIEKVAGPLVVAGGMSGCKMFELVRVGNEKLIGEIIRLELDTASIQVFFIPLDLYWPPFRYFLYL